MAATALVWFRCALRVHDHPPPHLALARRDRVVPVFVLDDRLVGGTLPLAFARALHARVAAGGAGAARRGLTAAEQDAAGCVIGRDHPEPIVDHAIVRRRTIAAYRAARA